MMKSGCLLGLAGRPVAVSQAAQTPQSIRMAGPEHASARCQYFLKQLDGLGILGRGVEAVGQTALAAEGSGILRAQQLASSVEISSEEALGLLKPSCCPTGVSQPVPSVNTTAVVGSQAPLQIFQSGSQECQLVLAGVVVAPIHRPGHVHELKKRYS